MSSKLRVLLDARMLLGRFSGVARVVTSLVEHLVEVPGLRVSALVGNRPYQPWVGTDVEMLVTDFGPEERDPVRRLDWEETRLAEWIRLSGADLWHATWNSGIPSQCPIPAVLTIHDVIPWRAPVRSVNAFLSRRAYRTAVRQSAARAARVITVSCYTAGQVRQAMRLPGDIDVVPNGVAIPQARLEDGLVRADLPHLLYVGGMEHRKNLAAVFQAMARFWQIYGRTIDLRLTGARSQLHPAAAVAMEQLPPDLTVRFLGQISDAQLADEYRRALALILLSTDEGFGLPVLEAMAYGCPVIAARRAALPEVAGDAALLVEPDDPDAAAAAIGSLMHANGLKVRLIERGQARAAGFSWAESARKTLDLYRRTMECDARANLSASVLQRRVAVPQP